MLELSQALELLDAPADAPTRARVVDFLCERCQVSRTPLRNPAAAACLLPLSHPSGSDSATARSGSGAAFLPIVGDSPQIIVVGVLRTGPAGALPAGRASSRIWPRRSAAKLSLAPPGAAFRCLSPPVAACRFLSLPCSAWSLSFLLLCLSLTKLLLRPQYAAVNALCTLGTPEALAGIDRPALRRCGPPSPTPSLSPVSRSSLLGLGALIWGSGGGTRFLGRLKNDDGSFSLHMDGESGAAALWPAREQPFSSRISHWATREAHHAFEPSLLRAWPCSALKQKPLPQPSVLGSGGAAAARAALSTHIALRHPSKGQSFAARGSPFHSHRTAPPFQRPVFCKARWLTRRTKPPRGLQTSAGPTRRSRSRESAIPQPGSTPLRYHGA